MTNGNDSGSGPGGYVEKVREDTQNYVRKLLGENEGLRVRVAELESRIARLAQDLRAAREELAHREAQEVALEQKLQEIRVQSEQYAVQYSQLEQHNANLANLYVASYQLHGTLDRAAVLEAMQEIVVNLIGSEEFAIFEKDEVAGAFRSVASVGIDGEPEGDLAHERVATCTSTGELYVGEIGASDGITICIPLKLDGQVNGAIVIRRLLAHKQSLEPLDHELFDLLASHAATALYCTSLHERLRLTA